MHKRLFASSLFLLLAAVGASPVPAHAGFGITPPYLRSHTLTRGSHFTQEIILVRGDPVDDLKTEITVDVPGIDDWITVDRGMTFTFPKGVNQLPIKIAVDVPKNTPFKAYKGNIRVRTSSATLSPTGVTIALGAQIDVDLEVVDKVYDFSVHRVELADAEEGFYKWWLFFPGRITFGMQIENTGNVPIAPSKVRFDIYDRGGVKLLETTENTNNIPVIAPFDTKMVTAYLPTRLPVGGYVAKYTIYKQDTIATTGELDLSILPRGTVKGYIPYGLEGLSLADKASLVGIGLLGVAAVLTPVITLKRRRSRKGPPKPLRRSLFARQPLPRAPAQAPQPPSLQSKNNVTTPSSRGHVVDLSGK